ncbi:MAG: hypothetical protein AAB092_09890 [Chloroflexota bacterium]
MGVVGAVLVTPAVGVLTAAFANATDASEGDIAEHGQPFLDAMASDLDTPTAIRELEALGDSDDPAAHRTGKTLGQQILGLSF